MKRAKIFKKINEAGIFDDLAERLINPDKIIKVFELGMKEGVKEYKYKVINDFHKFGFVHDKIEINLSSVECEHNWEYHFSLNLNTKNVTCKKICADCRKEEDY